MPKSSAELFEQAQKLIPGGVNSPVRACRSVGCDPLFIESGRGSKITSVDGQTYIDYVQSWGPLLLGHAHPEVTLALHAAVDKGSSFGAPCEAEIILAESINKAMPHIEMIRMVNSGTEATMSALRLARGFTGKNKIIKFEGCYHGHADAYLAAAGSGVMTLSIPGTPGVPASVVEDTLLAQYNNLNAVEALFLSHGTDIAAVIVEPVAGNMGLVLPEPGFLKGLRNLCNEYRALLIFDEVITGFRVAFGGASKRYNVSPDLTTLGKIIGGGLPVGAYGGKKEIMQKIAPCGNVYQAGTLSGNPLAMAAGIATLKVLSRCDYSLLEKKVAEFADELKATFKAKDVPVQVNHLASMFTIFFTDKLVVNSESAKTSDTALYTKFYQQLRKLNVNVAPSGFETAMVSFAHNEEDFMKTLDAVRQVSF